MGTPAAWSAAEVLTLVKLMTALRDSGRDYDFACTAAADSLNRIHHDGQPVRSKISAARRFESELREHWWMQGPPTEGSHDDRALQ